MSQSRTRASSKGYINKSMLSTHNISFNQSQVTNFFIQNKKNQSAALIYANIPLDKNTPDWNQSSATWRYTAHKYSFSKDTRFKDYKVEYSDIIQPQIPTTRTSKSCTFGKGKKRPISQITLRNAKEKPAPDRYNMENFDEQTRNRSKGKSFALNRQAFERNFIDHRRDIYAAFQTQRNPSAKYEVREIPGQNKKRFSMYGRLKMYTEKLAHEKNWVPGAHYEIKDRHLYNEVGLHDRNFGFAEKIDLSMPANDYPGPKYIIPGFCNQFRKIVHKSQKPSLQNNKLAINV